VMEGNLNRRRVFCGMAFSILCPCRLIMGSSKEASGVAPPPSTPTIRVSDVDLNTRVGSGRAWGC
jgi:hypothetical protein